MKKLILLIAVGAFFISSKSYGQQFVASFGITHGWNMPQTVYRTINYDYYGYDIVHASRIINRGRTTFDLVLQRGDVFVEVHLGARGRVIGRTFFDYYPLRAHVCNNYCGFHRTYYNTYRTVCRSSHHYGHNHVVYNRRRSTNVVYRDNRRPARGNNYHRNKPGRGNAYGYNKRNRGNNNAFRGNRSRSVNYESNNKRSRGSDVNTRSRNYEKSKSSRSKSSNSRSSTRRDRQYTSSRGN